MSVVEIEDLWKEYRLGVISHGTLTQDLQSWWAKLKGAEDPNSQISYNRLYDSQIKGTRFLALQGINLTVQRGEVLGLIGKNGAGKSTLLKILSRVTAPTKGLIKVKGRIASLLEVGTGFHPELTGSENIYMNGAILGMSRNEITKKLEEIVDFSGVEDFLDTPVKRYSSGMRVRLGFAVAAHLDPEILIIDEVLAVGDAEFQKKCLRKMSEVANSGRTVFFVSHNLVSIQNLCSRVILLENGSVKIDGETEHTVSEYLKQLEKRSVFIPLSKRTDRGGYGWLRFQDVEFYEGGREDPINVLTSGMKLRINLAYISQKMAKGVVFAIGFYTASGDFVFRCASDEIAMNTTVNKGKGSVEFILPKLPLTEGKYLYNVYTSHDNVAIDMVKSAGFVEVQSGDYYDTGQICKAQRPGVLIDYQFAEKTH